MINIKNFRAVHDKQYILELISEGEHERQDFKFAISDSRKIARSIAAFANNSGGSLLVGVKDNGNIAGIRSDEDFYMIEQAAETYCRPPQPFDLTLYNVEGKFVLKVDIPRAERRPVLAQDDNRQWQTYYRVCDENIQAPELLAKIWQFQERRNGVLLQFSNREMSLMNQLSESGPLTIDDIALANHLSHAYTEEAIVRLCAMGALEVAYIHEKWKIAIPRHKK